MGPHCPSPVCAGTGCAAGHAFHPIVSLHPIISDASVSGHQRADVGQMWGRAVLPFPECSSAVVLGLCPDSLGLGLLAASPALGTQQHRSVARLCSSEASNVLKSTGQCWHRRVMKDFGRPMAAGSLLAANAARCTGSDGPRSLIAAPLSLLCHGHRQPWGRGVSGGQGQTGKRGGAATGCMGVSLGKIIQRG